MFTGIIAEWMFSNRRDKIWDRETKTLPYFGDGKKEWICTTADDIAAYTVEAICAPDADKGGFIRVESFRFTPFQFAKSYERARSGKASANLECKGSIDDVVEMVTRARAGTDPVDHQEYIGLGYIEHMLKGSWDYEPVDCSRFPQVRPITLEEYFKQHPAL